MRMAPTTDMATLDLGVAAFVLLWGAPFVVAGMLGTWRPALALAALPVAYAIWHLLDAFALDPREVEQATVIGLARMVLLTSAACAALYAIGRWLRLRGERGVA